ncbi:hypothetical protein C8A01DRAFT_37995 [Parachaetomium inaequale]|uniref:T6SS Phospholipase effector Tle1-like catalytic domain-containing protein n=1 Tax=Parachaetomium inaequale TaxID=2588326 RepID=A0AAN6PDM0_9PEZI|nr:hypothetical protein C8A01DRAFT_37995 [Parachaetomium inaequale]
MAHSNEKTNPPTNASRLSAAFATKCCSGMPQVVYYHPGVGSTESSKAVRAVAAVTGFGVVRDIAESYRFICDNFNYNDEIILIGFSRGAFTARSVAAMVCSLGFLNRSGLDQFPWIYKDYRTWHKWHREPFDEKKHLVGITLENAKKLARFKAAERQKQPNGTDAKPDVLTDEALALDLSAKKRTLYEKMRRMEGEDRLKRMADAYREALEKYQLLLCFKKGKKWARIEGRVQAVGVWDTVGSLGIPRILPLHIRFVSPNVHPGVKYAFHAVALDEWRHAYDCTMWGKRGNNDKTQLRQVWFPGTHCNVGGGFEDQQIATIALAWMADQLASIGVEFSKTEMSRIFYNMHPKAKARKWGMGLIRNPNSLTAYPDWIWSYIAAPYRKLTRGTTDYPTRTPGGYLDDKGEKLVKPSELVHPCVRIRYLYGGLTMDDAGPWTCHALTERGYHLERRDTLATQRRNGHDSAAEAAYYSIRGPVTPYYSSRGPGTPYYDVLHSHSDPAPGTDKNPLVKVEQPHEDELCQLPEPRSYWVWKHEDGSELPEEHIGMWERLFIKVNNEKLVKWQEYADAKGAARANKGIFGWGSDAIKWAFGRSPQPPLPPLAAKVKNGKIPEEYGYHDLVCWQRGDTDPQPRKSAIV